MLTYQKLKEKPKEFLATTRRMVEELEHVLPVFCLKYAGLCEAGRPHEVKPSQRQEGGGVQEKLHADEDNSCLLFLLMFSFILHIPCALLCYSKLKPPFVPLNFMLMQGFVKPCD
jgi:hypothetical protein